MREYRPELIPRRGEYIAWTFTGLLLAAWLAAWISGVYFPVAMQWLTILLALTAVTISLGNWIDRHSRLRLGPEGIEFANRLHHVHLHWQEIQKVQVYPSEWGSKVHVFGAQEHFSFRTLGEVKLRGEIKGRMGFAEGEQILQTILQQAGLKRAQKPGHGEYYLRESTIRE